MSRRLPALTPRQVMRALQRAGFVTVHRRGRGSHRYFRHPDWPHVLIVIPHHPKDIKRSLLHSIVKDAGLTVEEFLELL